MVLKRIKTVYYQSRLTPNYLNISKLELCRLKEFILFYIFTENKVSISDNH
jgi:hypothetical protein